MKTQSTIRFAALLALGSAAALPALAQFQPQPVRIYTPTPQERRQLDEKERALAEKLKRLSPVESADAAVFLHTAQLADRLRLYSTQRHVPAVLKGLDIGLLRADLLARGERPWTMLPGRSLRGFVSRIDGSVQPYGVVLPAGFDPNSRTRCRLDVVLHGRGPTEVTFLQQQEPDPGSAAAKAPDQPFIELHAFGRANNGWRWAGETDVFEALEQVRKQYRIDPDRTILRGFSMGGHGAWQIGAHYPDRWAAVSPGAGFTETRNYIHVKPGSVPGYQERLWSIYDAVDYALNLFDTPFIAYGGEKDPQLQASLNMKEAAAKEGLRLKLIIGPNTEHRYHPDSLKEIMADLAERRRNPAPLQVKFTTHTLKYDTCYWVRLRGLEEHYRRADVLADAATPDIRVATRNVTRLILGPFPRRAASLTVDGQSIPVNGDTAHLQRRRGKWAAAAEAPGALVKRHNLQGPIDDAFMERFLVVRPTGTPWQESTRAYGEATLKRFEEDWRAGFRGEAPEKGDRAVTAADWKDANLVLFGDPSSNRLLARIAGKLPLRWTREGVQVGGRSYAAGSLPVLIYPNPLNPRHYVVINTGHTWTRKDIEASNAYLTPKLPDWAVLRVDGAAPEVQSAGFFDERWKVKAR